jgi:hypothetical protein
MSASRKYIVLKTREIRELLTPEQQQTLLGLIETMNTMRTQQQPQKGVPLYFTLNAADKYAVPALEAYIKSIDDDEMNSHNPGVQEARAVAGAARSHAIMAFDGTKLPT